MPRCCANPHLSKSTANLSEAVLWPKRRVSFGDTSIGGLVDGAEVVGEGSNLMKMMKFPTVIIKVRGGDLEESRVYHVLLESESDQFSGEIPALMFSKPSQNQRTRFAELFPLSVDTLGSGSASIKPMLGRRCHRLQFGEGCLFKVKSLSSGRFFKDSAKVPWNKLNLKARNMIAEIVHQDIREMSSTMIRRVARTSSRNSKPSSDYSSSTSSESSSQESDQRCLSASYPSLKIRGLTASGGSSFAKWFKAIPSDISVDKNFKCARGTTLRKDQFQDLDTYFKYLNISDTTSRTPILRKPAGYHSNDNEEPLRLSL